MPGAWQRNNTAEVSKGFTVSLYAHRGRLSTESGKCSNEANDGNLYHHAILTSSHIQGQPRIQYLAWEWTFNAIDIFDVIHRWTLGTRFTWCNAPNAAELPGCARYHSVNLVYLTSIRGKASFRPFPVNDTASPSQPYIIFRLAVGSKCNNLPRKQTLKGECLVEVPTA